MTMVGLVVTFRMEKGTCSDLHFLLDIVYKVWCVAWDGWMECRVPSRCIDRNTSDAKPYFLLMQRSNKIMHTL